MVSDEVREKPRALSKSVLKRLLQKGGVVRANKNVYEVMRRASLEFVSKLLHTSILLATQNGKVTIKLANLKTACKLHGINSVVGINPTASFTPSLVTGPVYPRKTPPSDAKAANGEKPKRKFKQGVVSSREIKFQQKRDNLVFRKLSFVKYCKAISKNPDMIPIHSHEVDLDALRYSRSLIAVLQVLCERYLIALAFSSCLIPAKSGQKTIKAEDVEIVMKIAEGCGIYSKFI